MAAARRTKRTDRRVAAVFAVTWAGFVGTGISACTDEIRSPRVLTDDPVVMGIAVSVLEDGPYADGMAPLPADRPRAEVLPLDTVELDALVANVDGPLDLSDAVWLLCGDGCLGSLQRQGERLRELPECHEGSVDESFACLAGRGIRPRVVIPDLVPDIPYFLGATRSFELVFPNVAVVVGRPGGPTTDACLEQLVYGPRVDLVGCGIGARPLPYGPPWAMFRLLDAVSLASFMGGGGGELPPYLTELLPPNAAAQIEEVRLGGPDDFVYDYAAMAWLTEPEPRSIDEVLEVEAGATVIIDPVVPARDQQLSLSQIGPDQWLGRPDVFFYNVWTDHPEVARLWWGVFSQRIELTAPPQAGPMRLYVVVSDNRGAVSWFTLDLRVIEMAKP